MTSVGLRLDSWRCWWVCPYMVPSLVDIYWLFFGRTHNTVADTLFLQNISKRALSFLAQWGASCLTWVLALVFLLFLICAARSVSRISMGMAAHSCHWCEFHRSGKLEINWCVSDWKQGKLWISTTISSKPQQMVYCSAAHCKAVGLSIMWTFHV